MVNVERSVLVGYSARRMYDLVEDIESYPAFLPWCGATEVTLRQPDRTVATIHVDYRGVRQQFSTENANRPGESITMRLVSGPFKSLDGQWSFRPLAEDACKIEFVLQYHFSSSLLEKLVGPVFNHIANTFVEAFAKRAEQVYGR